MEAAAKNNSPVMIQASNGGGQFMAGKSVKDKKRIRMHVQLEPWP